jgi:hypothetical protein
MIEFYPYNSPIILTDTIFNDYGGHATLGTPAQRSAMYLLSEIMVSAELDTYLLPTTVTGTYSFLSTIMTEKAYVNSISQISFIDFEGRAYYTTAGTHNIYYSLRNDLFGIIDINAILTLCNCRSYLQYPYQVQITYNAGLPSGTSYQPNVLMALVTYADILVNELIGYGNESPGDIGVQQFDSLRFYREQRVNLLQHTLGSSPRAAFATKLLTPLKMRRYAALHSRF